MFEDKLGRIGMGAAKPGDIRKAKGLGWLKVREPKKERKIEREKHREKYRNLKERKKTVKRKKLPLYHLSVVL